MGQKATEYRIAAGQIAKLWPKVVESLEQIIELSPARIATERIETACHNLIDCLGELIAIHKQSKLIERLQILRRDDRDIDLDDVQRRLIHLTGTIASNGYITTEEDGKEAESILIQVPNLGLDSGNPTDRFDCKYCAQSTSICWFGDVYSLSENQSYIIELACMSWKDRSGGWFSQKEAGETVESKSSDYRLKHTFSGNKEAFKKLFETDNRGNYRLRAIPL